jgi:ABC-type ATPase with predicted acetyltransferase domain
MPNAGVGFTWKRTGNALEIRIQDITKVLGASSTGKTQLVASSHGNLEIATTELGVVKLGLNCYIKPIGQ